MLNITDTALQQIRDAARQGNMVGMPLRVAAKRNDDGSIDYGMGFDDNKTSEDAVVEYEGLEVLIGAASRELLIGTTLDYVELEPGQFHFIFSNPNDPTHQTPTDS